MSDSRFPDGYMHYLHNHQFQAKTALQADLEGNRKAANVNNNNTKDSKPSRALYVPPGVRGGNSDLNGNTGSRDDTTSATAVQDDKTKPSKAGRMAFCSPEEREVTIDLDALDLNSFLPAARPLILAAIDKPEALMPRVLEEVAGYIVNRAWEDTTYFACAADICVFICVKERYSQRHFLPLYAFLRGLMIHTQELVDKWDEMRAVKLQYWHAFVRFMIRLFRELSERDFAVIMLAAVVLQIADALLTPLCLPNANERELMVMLVEHCGKHLQRTKPDQLIQLVNHIRDILLDPHPDPKVRVKLVQCVELYASNWKLTDHAKNFYNSS